MDNTDWAWAAGLFEGEGCISFSGVNSVYLTLAMADRDVVDRFQSIAGAGKIYVDDRGENRDIHYWRVATALDVERILKCLRPFFGERRSRKTDAAFERLTRVRRPGHCKRGHKISGDNLYVSPGGQRQCRACQLIRRPRRT